MTYTLDPRGEKNLQGVHPDLIKVVRAAIETTKIPFTVTEGVRTLEREKELIKKGFSSLKDPTRCRHVPSGGVSHAVDLVPLENGQPSWAHVPSFFKIADAMKAAANDLKVPVEWGGNWKSFRDYPHWQLPWQVYP
jgi:peptidoglycan LD-endopeptidase CwlK